MSRRKTVIKTFGLAVLSIVIGIVQAYLHSFQTQYITLLISGALYFLAGVFFSKPTVFFYRHFFLLPVGLILLFGGIINPLFRFSAIQEFVVISISYYLPLRYGYANKKGTALATIWLFVLCLFSFIINPRILIMQASSSSAIRAQHVPDFHFKDVKGNDVSLHTFKNKTILIDYWFIGCSPCYKKMNAISQLISEYRNDPNVVIWQVNTGIADTFEEFVAESKRLDIQNALYDPGGKFSQHYGINSFPFEVIIKNGTIVSSISGYNDDVALYYLNNTRGILKKR